MGLLDQAKDAAEALVGKVKDQELGDDFLADFIIRFTAKQEHINELLKEKGSNYRIGNLEVEFGVPPKATFVITSANEL